MSDIFDLLEQDVFDSVEEEDSAIERIKSELSNVLEKINFRENRKERAQITSEVKDFIKKEVARIKPIQNVIERTEVVHVPVPSQPKIVEKILQKETVVKEVTKKDDKVYAEEKNVEVLKQEIKDLKDIVERLKAFAFSHGGSGVVKSNDAYIPSNVTPTRNFDASSTSLNEVANVLGSLIQSLKQIGMVK